MAYHERFVSGDAQGGAYQCFLTLSDPDGWTLTAGGPASALVAPAARTHGVPGAVMAGAQAAAPFVRDAAGVPRLPRIVGAPPFTVKGPKNGKPGLERAEFVRQLTGQQDGLNRLTVAEFLANRDAYLSKAALTGDGRAAEGNAAQKAAREKSFQDKIDELRTDNEDLTDSEAQNLANQWLTNQTALHDPDQVAGGHASIIAGMGDA